jgi:micrococcal nuclease
VQKGIDDISLKQTIRLIGINTPETVDPRKKVECFGREASAKAKELLSGKMVRLEYDKTQDTKDKYGRGLAYVYVNSGEADPYISTNNKDTEIFFNEYMIASGFAYEYTYDKPYKYQKEFKEAQRNAQARRLGLWAVDACGTGN